MQVLWDGLVYSLQKSGGISKYTSEICSYFWKHSDELDVDLKLGMFAGGEQNLFAKELLKQHPQRVLSLGFANISWPFWNWIYRPPSEVTIIHSPYLNLPRPKANRIQILSINDLIFLDERRTLRSYVREALFRTAMNRADAFVFISQHVADDFNQKFPKYSKKPQRVIYLGVSEAFLNFDPANSAQLPETLDIDPFSYLLFVGVRSGYKNFQTSLTAFAKTPFAKRLKVVCVGGGAFSESELALIEELNLKSRIVHMNSTDDATLASLYGHAYALIYPSEREGFGLPILEAMACGCPVIARRASSMAEVGGEYPFYFESLSAASISKCLENAQRSINAARLQNATSYARGFTWKRTSLEVLAYYKDLSTKP